MAKIRNPIDGLRQKVRTFVRAQCAGVGKFNTEVQRGIEKTILVRCQYVPALEERPKEFEGYTLVFTQKL